MNILGNNSEKYFPDKKKLNKYQTTIRQSSKTISLIRNTKTNRKKETRNR